MKLLLTSNGLSNDSIADAFAKLIGKEPKDSRVAFIPTAANPERDSKGWLIDDLHNIKQRGYFVDIVELTAFKPEELRAILKNMDAVFVGGGNSFYLSYWMQKTGLFEFLPEFIKTKVYAGISAGSMVAGSSLLPSQALNDLDKLKDVDYGEDAPVGQGSGGTLNFVDIVFRPHLNSPDFPRVREEILQQVTPFIKSPMYALDDESALKIIDGNIEVISEGKWKKFEPGNK